MLIEIESEKKEKNGAKKSTDPNTTAPPPLPSSFTPAGELLLEEMLDRPVDRISDRDRRRAIARLAESTDPRLPRDEEEEEELINRMLEL